MNSCPKCGAITGEDVTVCAICSTAISKQQAMESGAAVAVTSRICPRCEMEVGPDVKYCKNCQMSFLKGDAFAWKGSILGGGGAAEETSAKKPFVIAASVVIASAAVIVLGIVYIGWSSNTPRAVIKRAFEAMEAGDGEALMKLQYRKARESIKPADDEPKEYLERVTQTSREIKSMGGVKLIDIAEEEIKNDEKAMVTFTIHYGNGEKKSNKVRMVKENGKWKFVYWPLTTPSQIAREALLAMDQGDGEVMGRVLSRDRLARYSVYYDKQEARLALNAEYARLGEIIKINGGITAIEIMREQETEDEAAVDYIIKLGNGDTRDRQMWLVKERGIWKVYSHGLEYHGLRTNPAFETF